jgi:hypothetical protein
MIEPGNSPLGTYEGDPPRMRTLPIGRSSDSPPRISSIPFRSRGDR